MDPRTQGRIWALAPAVLALAGVLLGVLATGGLDHLRRAEERSAELRQAKRLVALEVVDNAIGLSVLDTARMGSPDSFKTDTWKAKRELLARHLSDDEWWTLSSFYDDVRGFRETVAESPSTLLPDARLDGIRAARRTADAALIVLGDQPMSLPKNRRRVPYRPSKEERDPGWAEWARFMYAMDRASTAPE